MAGKTRKHVELLLNASDEVKLAMLRGPDLPVWLEILLLNAALKGVVRRFKPHERDEVRARLFAARFVLSEAVPSSSDDPAAFDNARTLLDGLAEELASLKFPKVPRTPWCTPMVLVRHHLMLTEALEDLLPRRTDSKGWRRALCDRLPAMVEQVRAVPCSCELPGRPNGKEVSSAPGKPKPPTDLAFELVALCHSREESSVRKIIHQQRGELRKLTSRWRRVLSPRQP